MTLGDIDALSRGLIVTASVSAASILCGQPLGLAMALIRWANIPIATPIVAGYVSILRATPILMCVLLIFFALPNLGVDVGPVSAGVLSLTLNTAAYNCEIWRSGLMNFPKEQLEAARAFGFRPSHTVLHIVVPQIWRSCLPGLINEMTIIIKGSPAIAVVGLVDITRAAARIGAATYDPLPPFVAAMILYIILLAPLALLQRMIEAPGSGGSDA